MDKTIAGKVKALLLDREHVQLIDLCVEDRNYWKALRQSLYETNEDMRRSAIEAAALLMKKRWRLGDKERVRDFMRRLMWSMNDESGEIGWSAPETIAATIALIPELLDPFGSMMLDRALEELPLLEGALWGIGHNGIRMKETVGLFQDMVLRSFATGNPQTLGTASWAMGEAGFAPALPYLKELEGRNEPVSIYIEGRFQQKPLGQWARDAIGKIDIST